jgi:acyl-CoA thioesterase I
MNIFACTLFILAGSPMQDRLQPERPSLLRNVRRIVCLGDSITQAAGQPGGYVWLLDRYLKALYGPQAASSSAGGGTSNRTSPETGQTIEVVNAGISGHKATDMQARFQRDVLDKKPDLVTISVGVNDVWHAYRDFAKGVDHPNGDLPAGVPLSLYREKVTQMIQAAKGQGIKVVLVAPTLIYENLGSHENQRLLTYVSAMRDLAKEHGCAFVDLNAACREVVRTYQKYGGRSTNLLTTDGVHMNPAGNRLMAYTILRGMGVRDREITDLKVGP